MDRKNDKSYILGIPFSKRDRLGAYTYISNALSEGRSIKIFTPNAEILYKTARSPRLAALLKKADLLLPDGSGVVAASRLLGDPLPCRITGIDTAEYILSVAEKQGLSVYLLGGKEGIAARAAASLTERFPRLQICGHHHGYFTYEEELVEKISAARPHILFVCMGFPAQEKFIVENAHKIPTLHLSMGLGGSLDVWSGDVRRAPKIVQKAGAEWLYRVIIEPRRIRRLPYLGAFAIAVLKSCKNTYHKKELR